MQSPTHVCLVSDQPLANLLPALDAARPAVRVVLATSPEMATRADASERVLRGYQMTVERLPLPSAYDMAAISTALHDWIDKQVLGSDIWLNATGGTKPMAMAAQEVFRERNLPVFYLNHANDEVVFLGGGGNHIRFSRASSSRR